MSAKKDIRLLSSDELIKELSLIGEKPFRAKQIYEWLWAKSVHSFDEMSNLSKELREKLNQSFFIKNISVADRQVSTDRTIKYAFKLFDGKIVEGVLIPTEKRMTACISSQVGCSLTCAFCATGKLKRQRNLDADEIYDQIIAIKNEAEKTYNQPLTNIVYMGMGEPMLNYKNVLQSVNLITTMPPLGLGMAPSRITVSTAGVEKMIRQLGDDGVKFNLALSLHAANDEKRSKIMPINETNSLKHLAEALKYYFAKTKKHVTYEYIIFKDFNDSLEDAKELAAFCKHVPSKVNIIEYNSIDGGEFTQADTLKADAFAKYLSDRKIVARIRRSRGKDIDAACGQLANKNKASV